MTASTHVKLELRAALENRPLAIDLVLTLIAHVTDADRAFRNDMITAFGEAFNNVVAHGYPDRSDGMITVDAEMTAAAMTLRLSDSGLPVDFASVAPPDFDSVPESGMGIFMIQAMVDEVTYEGGNPNVLSLTKRMTHTNQTDLTGPENR
jgi:anti-sigma regulatory factor (Ser/Thr protein kinase)